MLGRLGRVLAWLSSFWGVKLKMVVALIEGAGRATAIRLFSSNIEPNLFHLAE
jgi:hypothetical protein